MPRVYGLESRPLQASSHFNWDISDYKMKIVFVSHSSRLGGAERVLLETIEVLRDRGIACCVLVPTQGDLCIELSRLGVEFRVISFGLWMTRVGTPLGARLKSAVSIAAAVIPVANQIKRWKCGVVYSNSAAVCVGAFAARLLGLPHVWHLQEFGYEDHRLVFLFGKKSPFMIMNTLSAAWIANSNAVQAKYGRYMNLEKSKVIYYSMHRGPKAEIFSVESQLPGIQRGEAFRCIIVGTLFENKGQEDAVRAVAELKKRDILVELLVVGDGKSEYRSHLMKICAEKSIEKQVIFLGHVEKPGSLVFGSDIALVCSKAEAFGRVTVEAMLAGKAVIGADSGATPELIRDGYNGLLYRAGDSVLLADKIQYLYKHPGIARQFGENGRQWARERFTKERYAAELTAVLNSVSAGAQLGTSCVAHD
jgi:glycosyltransferase involved in cell wall biosynthesis